MTPLPSKDVHGSGMSAELPLVQIYTDGACSPNPGPGGWAAILRSGTHEREISGADPATTNNRMELTAAIRALQSLKRPCRVELYTDSEYLQRGITEWMPGWIRRGWKRSGGALANVELWQELAEAMKPHEVRWHWLKGHAGQKENERADALSRKARTTKKG
jgi:ribonuclease HI